MFYQEVRAVSNFDGPFRVLGGATYLTDEQHFVSSSFLLGKVNSSNTDGRDTVKNWSIYAQVAYDITSELSLTVSGRYQHETNHATFTVPVVSANSGTESKFTPSVTLDYKLPNNGTAYARWARGFKSGGVLLTTAPAYFPTTEGSVFGPETVDTYEVGWRQSFLDRKLQFTSAIFYNDYRDVQLSARGNAANPRVTTAVTNAKKARSYGAEGSITAQVIEPLTLSANIGYLNAKYIDYKVTSTVLVAADRSGFPMTHAPKWQMSFIADFDQPINDKYRAVASIVESYKSDDVFIYSGAPGVVPDAVVPSYWVTNLRVGVRSIDERYGVFLVGDNLFNARVYGNANSFAFGNVLAYANPRIIRGEIQVKF
jgi:iron complex outermembrane receptor protein